MFGNKITLKTVSAGINVSAMISQLYLQATKKIYARFSYILHNIFSFFSFQKTPLKTQAWTMSCVLLFIMTILSCVMSAILATSYSFNECNVTSIPAPVPRETTVYPKKYAHGFVVLCFVVVMQSFMMNSHEVFIRIHQGCFAGTGAIVRLPQCQRSKPDGYGNIRQCLTTTKHSKAVTVCIFLGKYCMKLHQINLKSVFDVTE